MATLENLIPIHTKVKGRARFKVKGLLGSPSVRSKLEDRLKSRQEIRWAKANPTTGTVLVTFDPQTDWHRVAAVIEDWLPLTDDHLADRSAPNPAPSSPPRPWYQRPAAEVLASFDASVSGGLDRQHAKKRLQQVGPNTLKTAAGRSRTTIFLSQVKSLPLLLLAVEAFIASAGGAFIEPLLLLAVIMANAGVGTYIDRRAERAISGYKKRPRPHARVIRSSEKIDVPGEALVPGDLLVLKPGTSVGADSRIVEADNLKIDESMLTGESIPVDKTTVATADDSIPLADRHCMAYMGTLVVGGRGLAVVTATGQQTEFGRLYQMLEETIPPQTPLIKRLHAMTGQLFKFGLTFGTGIYMLELLMGRSPLRAFWTAASIAAASVPAGLPSAATLNMAVGIRKLKSENVSVQRLYALESLGTVEMICFDKTGTLTRSRISVINLFAGLQRVTIDRNRFRVKKSPIDPAQDPDIRQLILAAVLCGESKIDIDPKTGQKRLSGSPTEMALLHMGIISGIDVEKVYDDHPLHSVQHRSETRRLMTTIHSTPNNRFRMFVKGDPYEVLDKCSRQMKNGRRIPLSLKAKTEIEQHNARMADKALRVLGFAMGQVDEASGQPSDQLHDLVWLGLVGMAEPIRQGVGAMVAGLHRAGIDTAMITGDQSPTALAVAKKIGLSSKAEPKLIDSSRFDTMPPELLEALTRDVRIFSRVNPAQKLQIVRGFQADGRVVAMTGDGINDGPALRAADIGIAMGLSGTDVAREVADVVLEKDNITAISDAVRQGRVAFRNLKRSVRFFITANLSDTLLAAAAVSTRRAEILWSLRPVQINLLTDLAPGLALLMETSDPNIDIEPPRSRQDPFFTPMESAGILTEAAVISGGAALAGIYGIGRYGAGLRSATLIFETLSAAKALHALTCRPLAATANDDWQRDPNRFLQAALVGALGVQFGIHLIPELRRLLGVAPLGIVDIGVIGLLSLATQCVNQSIRVWRAQQ